MTVASAPDDRHTVDGMIAEWSSMAAGHAAMRVLMTVDGVGGVWRYAMELARALGTAGIHCVFVGLGPRPGAEQVREAEELGELIWIDEPLDWSVTDERELDGLPRVLKGLVERYAIDLLHLNLPSQACDLDVDVPVLVVSHSCVVTWWETMRAEPLPDEWRWQLERNRRGLTRADIAIAPSHSHANAMKRAYGPLPHLQVIHNASDAATEDAIKADYIFAAGRWWDEGKNAAVLDAAAKRTRWPVVAAGSLRGPDGQHVEMGNVTVEGPLSHAAVLGFIQKAGILVSPSRYEPFGLAALEGARAGTALVLSDIPTYRELWDGAALFFDPMDATALAQTLDYVSAKPKLRLEMGDRARRRSRRFAPQVQAYAMAGLYARMARPKKPGNLRA